MKSLTPEHAHESAINLVAEGTRMEGRIQFDSITRVHGVLVGEVRAAHGSTLVLSDNGMIEGQVYADVIYVNGMVQGDIEALTRVVISSTGRVVGNIKTPSLQIDFGAYFEGRCLMESTSLTRAAEPSRS